jgi:hypothetical protein
MGASVSTHDAVTLEKAKELLGDKFRVRVDACFAKCPQNFPSFLHFFFASFLSSLNLPSFLKPSFLPSLNLPSFLPSLNLPSFSLSIMLLAD